MNTVAVDADRFVGLLSLKLLFEDHCSAMKVGYIAVENIGADPILRHQFLVGVTFSAKLRREEVEIRIRWTRDVMNAMTINAGRYIRITLID